ncbi:hypothetical protein DIE02_16460 [Burkholderia sp. Bp8991]|nr:hypothetical protein DIE02_16460 [Burkholderia sp. Bp8991]
MSEADDAFVEGSEGISHTTDGHSNACLDRRNQIGGIVLEIARCPPEARPSGWEAKGVCSRVDQRWRRTGSGIGHLRWRFLSPVLLMPQASHI